MKCAGCLKILKQESLQIICSSGECGKCIGSPCINIAAMPVDRKKLWKCPDCAALKKGGDNSHTPVRSSSDSTNVTVRRKPDYYDSPSAKLHSPASVSSDIRIKAIEEVQELTLENRCLTKEISVLKSKLEEATISLTICNQRLDELGSKIGLHETRIAILETKTTDTNVLTATIEVLKDELNTQAQNNLKNEIEIAGIEEHQNENLYQLVLVAGCKLAVDISEQDIDWINRVGSRKPLNASELDLPKLPTSL